ncbi:putative mitochondrial protein [Dendrobium catenatum]|uniref:Putative mitochondrial protein n=1 Tax=Dendrobium catenatum TaxID=906689 RepID=A0A2I0WN28_9ASPA|nr:putative mitochondrial protein [Dendrobium catenatum]
MKALGLVHNFIGINIIHYPSRYFLSQQGYALSILQQANLTKCNPLSNPTFTKLPIDLSLDPLLSDPALYRRLTGSLQYLTLMRPDIAYAVNLLSQHMHNPQQLDVYLLKHTL